jgi:uncharacterized protein with HEPN domain
MSARNWNDLVRDFLDAIAEIEGFTRGQDQAAFASDIKTIRAVELNFIVIGEAASRVPSDVQQANAQIPWAVMKAMWNRLVTHTSVWTHAYCGTPCKTTCRRL